LRAIRRKIPCPHSSTYDAEHEVSKPDCLYKHAVYHWEGITDNKVVLVSDSICKWVRGIPHLEVKALPGLNLPDAFDKMCRLEIDINHYQGLIFHVGTNSLDKEIDWVLSRFRAIVNFLKTSIFNTKFAICMIIPKPASTPWEDRKRRIINSGIKELCKKQRITYLSTFKGEVTTTALGETLFCEDGIHLNRLGLIKMKKSLRGAAAYMLDRSTYRK
jgi:hypothetical protein